MKTLQNGILIILILMLAANLLFNACKKEVSAPVSQPVATFAMARNASDFVVEMTDAVGNCYVMVVQRNADNSVTYQKIPVPCDSNSTVNTGIFFATEYFSVQDGKIHLFPERTYWFIPADEGETPEIVSGYFECFCEGSHLNDPFCEGMPARCEMDNSSTPFGTRWFCQSICCTDCDMRWCPDILACSSIQNGIVIEADSLSEYSGNTGYSSYFGENTRLSLSEMPTHTLISRTPIDGNANHLLGFYNLTDLIPDEGSLNIPEEGKYWFVPFDAGSGVFRLSPTQQPDCVSADPPCSGKCELVDDPNKPQCKICKCSKSGDCDMKIGNLPYRYGLVIQADSIVLIE